MKLESGAVRFFITLTILTTLAGCMVADQVRTIPGTDLSNVRPGLNVTSVEEKIGHPIRIWSPNPDVEYRLYGILLPLEGSPSEGAALLFLDVVTVGLFEGIDQLGKSQNGQSLFDRSHRQERSRVWVGFDASGQAFGLYDEWDPLPRTVPSRD